MTKPPISSRGEARARIVQWLEVVARFPFPDIEHKSPRQRTKAADNRRRTLLAVGEIALDVGSITPALSRRQVAERAGLPESTVRGHLAAEAASKRFLRREQKGRPGVGSRWASVYKLHVDHLGDLDSSPESSPHSSPDSSPTRQTITASTDAVHLVDGPAPWGPSLGREIREGEVLPYRDSDDATPEGRPPLFVAEASPPEGGIERSSGQPRWPMQETPPSDPPGPPPGPCEVCGRPTFAWYGGRALCPIHKKEAP